MSSIHLADIERMLARQGYALARIRGSHRHYRNAQGQVLTFSAHHPRGPICWRRMAEIRQDIARLAGELAARELSQIRGGVA